VNPIDQRGHQTDSLPRATGDAASLIPALTAEYHVRWFAYLLVWQEEVGRANVHTTVASSTECRIDDYRAV